MHLYTLTRGLKQNLDTWENDLGAQWMPLKYKLPDVLYQSGKKKGKVKIPGKIVDGRIKLAIREVKLHEFVFPKEYEEAVMGLINPASGKLYGLGFKFIKSLISLLGLKKPLKKWAPNNIIFNDAITCVALGTKEDVMNFQIPKSVQEQGIIPQEKL